jgi:flagellar assembly factor FliW
MNGTMQEHPTTSPTAADEAANPEADPTVDASGAVFEHGLLGFPHSKRFALSAWGTEDGPFLLMKSLDDTSEFLVADPEAFFPDYEPEIDLETAEWLGIATPEDAVVLVIVSVPDQAEHATANLLGPLVINRGTRRSMQMVLNDPWTTRHPLFQVGSSTD